MFALYRTSKNLPVRSLPFITALFLAAVVGLTALALTAPTQHAEARTAGSSNHDTIENVKGCSEPMTRGGTAVDFICFDRATQGDSTNPSSMDFNMPEGPQIIQLDNVYLYNDGNDGIVQLGFDTDWYEDSNFIPRPTTDNTTEKLVPSLDPPNGGAGGLTIVIKLTDTSDSNNHVVLDEVLVQYGATPSLQEDTFFRDGRHTSTAPNYNDEDYYGVGTKFTLKDRTLNLPSSITNNGANADLDMEVTVYYKDITTDTDPVVVCGWNITEPLDTADYVGYQYQYLGSNLPKGWYISANEDTAGGDIDKQIPGNQYWFHEYHLKNSIGVTVPDHDEIPTANVPGTRGGGLNSTPATTSPHASCLFNTEPAMANPDPMGFDAWLSYVDIEPENGKRGFTISWKFDNPPPARYTKGIYVQIKYANSNGNFDSAWDQRDYWEHHPQVPKYDPDDPPDNPGPTRLITGPCHQDTIVYDETRREPVVRSLIDPNPNNRYVKGCPIGPGYMNDGVNNLRMSMSEDMVQNRDKRIRIQLIMSDGDGSGWDNYGNKGLLSYVVAPQYWSDWNYDGNSGDWHGVDEMEWPAWGGYRFRLNAPEYMYKWPDGQYVKIQPAVAEKGATRHAAILPGSVKTSDKATCFGSEEAMNITEMVGRDNIIIRCRNNRTLETNPDKINYFLVYLEGYESHYPTVHRIKDFVDYNTPRNAIMQGDVDISAGYYHTCALNHGNGAVQCWGKNSDGETNVPIDLTGTKYHWDAVSAGDGIACGVTDGKNAVCWGKGYSRSTLGHNIGTVINDSSGAPYANVKDVAVGGRHACLVQEGSDQPVCFKDSTPSRATSRTKSPRPSHWSTSPSITGAISPAAWWQHLRDLPPSERHAAPTRPAVMAAGTSAFPLRSIPIESRWREVRP